jgi:tetratricopeptide (TPR) repeat protein
MVGDVRINDLPPKGTLPSVPLCDGDLITVGATSRAAIYLVDADTPVRLDENTVGRIQAPSEPGSGLLDVTRGAIYFLSQVRRTLTIRTPYVNAGIEGTEVYLRVREAAAPDAPAAELIVLEGRVAVTPGARVAFPAETVTTGERVEVMASGAPRRTSLPSPGGMYGALREVAVGALSWTLFYPDILTQPEAVQFPRIEQAARFLAAGQVADAEALLANVPSVATEAGLKDALLAIIAVGRKDTELARQLAEQAVTAAPGSAVPLLALSYARQLAIDLDGAFAAAEAAAGLAPREPLPRARLAEIHLMRGETRAARRAANEAVKLGGGPLAQLVLGYAELAALRGARGEAAFRRALEEESWSPLALLGLGLAQIKRGDLGAGTTQIENAVTHDPGSSLLRSYLGKAFFEERRAGKSERQFAIAKELDPTDPTPWLYDAIRLQLGNRPIAALDQLREAIARNDNRAPFRSRLLLDQDQSLLGVSVGRIYNDLGFEQQGINEAARALFVDPANAAAHRFRTELYRDTPRLQAATASEQLQAQIFQPVGLNPVRPGLVFDDLNIVRRSGPAEVGFGEYNRLFQRDGFQVSGSGLIGTDATRSDELVATGLYGRTSVSAGQFHYETDGFRPNSAQKHDILDVFAQTLVRPDFSVQAEFIHRDTLADDLELRFDTPPDPDLHRSIKDNLIRTGANLKVSPDSVLVLSGIFASRERNTNNENNGGPSTSITDTDSYTGQLEAQWVLRLRKGVLVSGVGGASSKAQTKLTRVTSGSPSDTQTFSAEGGYGFVEWLTPIFQNVDLTLRFGYDRVELEDTTTSGITPGVGLDWRMTDKITARATASRIITRPTTVDQSLFPTAIAGFNQEFDEFEATTADLLALALQYQPSQKLTLGLLARRRWISDEFSRASGNEDDEVTFNIKSQVEDHAEIYLDALLGSQLAATVGADFDRYRQKWQDGVNQPVRLTTFSLPLGIRYFAPSGWYASFLSEFLAQRQELNFNTEQQTGTDSDLLLDAEIGYRFGAGRGVVFVRGDNLLDRKLAYRDDLFRSPRTGQTEIGDAGRRFLPNRTLLVGLSLTF